LKVEIRARVRARLAKDGNMQLSREGVP